MIAFHFGLGLPGGFLGVDLFFVISGFVITRLLLSRRLDRAALLDFWRQRARRLLPALLVVIAAVQAWMLVAEPPGLRDTVNAQTLAALVYMSNWYAIVGHVGYWDVAQTAAPLNHLWSLAIEEQFYLFWPVLLVVVPWLFRHRGDRVRRRALLFTALTLASTGYVLSALLCEPDYNRSYLGTDTRAGALLLGAAVAMVPKLRVNLLIIAIPALGALWWTASVDAQSLYTWQLPLAGAAAATLIHGLVHGSDTSPPICVSRRVLAARPILWVGRRSYGIYLWHWPVWVFLGVQYPAISHPAAVACALAATALISALSYRFVEQPIRAGRGRALILLPALACCLAALTFVTQLPVPAPVDATNGPIVTGPNHVGSHP